jgi:hypothetical protein
VVGKVHSSRNEKASSYSHRGLHDPGQAGVVRQDYPQGMERSLLFFHHRDRRRGCHQPFRFAYFSIKKGNEMSG